MPSCFLTLLVAALLALVAACAQQTNAPPMSKAEVTAFMDKWGPVLKHEGAFGFGSLYRAETNAPTLLIAAAEREPDGPWCWTLQIFYKPRGMDKVKAAEACSAWKRAHAAVASAAQKAPAKEVLQQNLRVAEENLATSALAVGEDLPLVRQMAERLLRRAGESKTNWDRGNLIYTGHSLLGHVAIRQGKFDDARQQLRQAGQTPGSPQLNSLGPQFDLARELLKHGEEADRDAVIAFLDEVAKFWANPDKKAYAPSRQGKVKKRELIETWKEEIRAGRIPKDYQWR